MKKIILRGREKKAIANSMPKSLEYNVWYNLVTPFDWQYFKFKKGSRYVSVYDFINDKNPQFTVTKKRFLNEILLWAKSPPKPIEYDE
ncbi:MULTISPECIES: hypothetical protein [unclassified Psychrobacillus]|uniref:hypothetical protein n=1 Tax=unclassified Psychrobacillus TaxID=2636677 RepID=UPI0030F89FB7